MNITSKFFKFTKLECSTFVIKKYGFLSSKLILTNNDKNTIKYGAREFYYIKLFDDYDPYLFSKEYYKIDFDNLFYKQGDRYLSVQDLLHLTNKINCKNIIKY